MRLVYGTKIRFVLIIRKFYFILLLKLSKSQITKELMTQA